jgi:hypothetical protein
MPKMRITNIKNIMTFHIWGNEERREDTSNFIPGMELIVLRGLITLMALNDLRFGMLGNTLDIPSITTIKSSLFQLSLK